MALLEAPGDLFKLLLLRYLICCHQKVRKITTNIQLVSLPTNSNIKSLNYYILGNFSVNKCLEMSLFYLLHRFLQATSWVKVKWRHRFLQASHHSPLQGRLCTTLSRMRATRAISSPSNPTISSPKLLKCIFCAYLTIEMDAEGFYFPGDQESCGQVCVATHYFINLVHKSQNTVQFRISGYFKSLLVKVQNKMKWYALIQRLLI